MIQSNGGDEDEEDFPGLLLHQAALWENAELLEDLLEGDQLGHINTQDAWGRTPLYTAAMRDSGCLRILLQSGANPNIAAGPRCENRTPLHLSAENGFVNNIMLLLAHKADTTTRDALDMTAFDIAQKFEHWDCVEVLKKAQDAREQSRHVSHKALREAVLSGDYNLVKLILHELQPETELIINLAPNGASTLLYSACEMGKKNIVKLLLEHGADGRIHQVTRYSPLYIACFKGHKDIVEILIKTFPQMVQQYTVERWLPLHAACLNGHTNIVEYILKYQYPSNMLCNFKEGEWEYDFAFDLNFKDVSGQTVLYLSCFLGHSKLVEMLLKFKVKAFRKPTHSDNSKKQDTSPELDPDILSPTRRKISDGIQSIMSRLSLGSSKQNSSAESNERFICPWHINTYCNNATETALHTAVRSQHNDIATMLLNNGANPNLVTKPASIEQSNQSREDNITPLVEACRNRDISTVDLLLKHGARDDDCKALAVVVASKDDLLTTKLLAIKAFPDPEFRINKKAMNERTPSSGVSLTYSSLFANTPVMINWHAQKCQLNRIRSQWLVDAALHVNPKLKINPKSQDVVLYAITRIDISNNSLSWLPPIIFQLQSLKYLNAAQNKIERLPNQNDFDMKSPLHMSNMKRNNSSNNNRSNRIYNIAGYSLPFLEELYLQFNRLDTIPEEIFHLPMLITLDLSNNKLQTLSYQMWRAPKLKELNVSFNLLKDLPALQNIDDSISDTGSVCSVESSSSKSVDSATETPQNSSSYDCDIRFKDKNNMRLLNLTHHNLWSDTVEVTEQILHNEDTDGNQENCCPLSSLNLAHNLFASIPSVLPCLAVNLTRLNMAYNSLRSMSHITSYPNSLKQLDLSHNKISCWPSLPQVDSTDNMEIAAITCYCPESTSASKLHLGPLIRGRQSLRTNVLNSVCVHRRHLRLDNLRTLILADNLISRIQLSTDDDGSHIDNISMDEVDTEWGGTESNQIKNKLMFPNLSMLDLSNNQLKEIPSSIHELSNLSVLNVSNNADITELPYQMGLLNRLWNLNTKGCTLQEPLKSMIESNKYKTMDIIGYLKSVLEDAKPYARMKLMIVGIQGIGKTSLLEQLRVEGTRSKKKPVEHWAKRMGNKNIDQKNSRGTNISTVGVDIGDWVYEKKVRGNPYGPVTFRTWDFGGQREYYATHQYFLSKRSLYLVVWKIPEGQKAIDEILQWLVNIQARAPNSPVIIVGTHYDMVKDSFPPTRCEDLQQLIRDRFINIVDAEKCGLPRVLDTIEISCKTRHNIKLLCNLIYDTVYSLKPAGSKELLLEQKVPASYLALEDVIGYLAVDRKLNNLDPVLSSEQYKNLVTTEMMQRYQRSFRDAAELHQATLFLHDNGVLLHYDDATLKDLYFLDPQWLCDMLAHVVTIREINPFVKCGIMQLNDLNHIFKNTKIGNLDTKGYIVNLLNKFEVALTWDSRTLLIPSLLPVEQDLSSPYAQIVKVKIPVRTRGWAVRNKKIAATSNATGSPYFGTPNHDQQNVEVVTSDDGIEITHRSDPEQAIRRLLLMSYFPSGFWSRLMTRLLADDAIVDIVMQNAKLSQAIDKRAEWILWQTGMELRFSDTVLFRMREVSNIMQPGSVDYRAMNLRIKQEGIWQEVDLESASILEILLPSDTIVIKQPIRDDNEPIGYQAMVLDPSPERTAQLLALAVDHIDVLLEDWYPTLGTRFVHTSEGKFLVTRLIPCPRCLGSFFDSEQPSASFPKDSSSPPSSSASSSCHNNNHPKTPLNVPINEDLQRVENDREEYWRVRKSQESYTSDGDSGVGRDSTGSSRKPSVEGHPNIIAEEAINNQDQSPKSIQYSWMVEECILAAYDKDHVKCPIHSDILLAHIAPDTMFLDLGDRYLIRPNNISRGKLLGRGAFGFVFKGTYKIRGGLNKTINIAMKMLQPVQPEPNSSQSAIIAYKNAQGKWDRDPLQYSSKAYCTARQELNILLNLRHTNIVPLIGICTKPLALILDLAPMGALDSMLRHYRRSGCKLDISTIQNIILQVAKALEYLHQQHIIYRDLKSENVLVWSMPQPFDTQVQQVNIKLADYGISRLTLPSGTKGFGGTEGFMAPEIMKYNGEEEYTEKVDCFSFGMFIYELLTLHQPFENYESVKECILEGNRPSLTHKDILYPTYILDLMTICWNQNPKDRPSTSQIVSIASAPEFTHLYDVISLNINSNYDIIAGISIITQDNGSMTSSSQQNLLDDTNLIGLNNVTSSSDADTNSNNMNLYTEILLACENYKVDKLLISERTYQQYSTIDIPECPTSICIVNNSCIWIGDIHACIHCYSLSNYKHVFSYSLLENESTTTSNETTTNENVDNDIITNENAAICSIIFLPKQYRVVIGLTNGRIFLVRSDFIPITSKMGEGSFVMTEIGSSIHLNTITTLFNIKNTGECSDDDEDSSEGECQIKTGECHKNKGECHNDFEDCCELWCGENNGNISIYKMINNCIKSHDIINHFNPIIQNIDVSLLISSHSPSPIGQENMTSLETTPSYVWSYVYPGSSVYQWNCNKRIIINKLDCSKLVPCSESLKSICIDEDRFSNHYKQCQITSLCILKNNIYIGTSSGCIIVGEKNTMTPITVFRPFEQIVSCIIPLYNYNNSGGGTGNSGVNCGSSNNNNDSSIVTIGRGYRSLISRYVDINTNNLSYNDSSTNNNSYALIWSQQNWEAA